MDGFSISTILVLLVMVAALYSSIKIAGESERFAVFVLGRFAGFKGPGLVLKGSASKFVRLKVGEIGEISGPGFGQFSGVDVPLADGEAFEVGDAIRVEGFAENGLNVNRSARPPKRHCPNCGHEF